MGCWDMDRNMWIVIDKVENWNYKLFWNFFVRWGIINYFFFVMELVFFEIKFF